jgi:hypothetical protein
MRLDVGEDELWKVLICLREFVCAKWSLVRNEMGLGVELVKRREIRLG